MTTIKPARGRHRATVEGRTRLPAAVRPLLVRGGAVAAAVALLAAVVTTWQVV